MEGGGGGCGATEVIERCNKIKLTFNLEIERCFWQNRKMLNSIFGGYNLLIFSGLGK